MRKRLCDVAVQSPCARAVHRRLPALFRRGFPRGGGGGLPADQNIYAEGNYAASNSRQTAAGGGEPGTASGFGGAVLLRMPVLGSAIRVLWERLSGNTGYTLYLTAANVLTLEIKSTAGASSSAFQGLNANDVGRLLLVCFQHTGSAIRLLVYRDNSPSGDVAITGYGVPTTGPTTLGVRAGGAFPATGIDFVSDLMFTGTPSLSQMRAFYDATRTNGDVPESIDGGVVTHRWSLRDELRGVDKTPRKTYGARGFGASGAAYQTAQGANTGIVGSALGNYAQAYIRPTAIISSNYFLARWSGVAGFMLEQANSVLQARFGNGTVSITSPTFTIGTAANSMLLMTAVWDQPAQKLRLYIDGVEVGTGSAMLAYVPLVTATERMYIGRYSGSGGSDGGPSVFQVAGGDIIPTAAQLLAQAEATRQAGKLVPLAAAHLYDIDADVKASGNLSALPTTVTDRAGTDNLTLSGTGLELAVEAPLTLPAPPQLTDTTTRALSDALIKIGGPVVRVIDPSVDGRRTLGAQGSTEANYFQSATAMRGAAGGFTVGFYGRLDGLTSALRILLGTGTQFDIRSIATSGNVSFACATSGGAFETPAYAVTAADLAQPMLIIGQYDQPAGRVRLFVKRVEVGSTAATGTYTPSAGVFRMGNYPNGSLFPAASVSYFGAFYADSALTLAEIQALFDECETTGRVPTSPKFKNRYDLTTDILASGVDAVTAQVLDRVGTDHLTRVGPDYQIAGKRGLRLLGSGATLINGLSTAPGGGILGSAAALTVEMLWSPTGVLSGTNELFASMFNSTGGPRGWFFQRAGTAGTLGTIGCTLVTSTGPITVASGNYAIQPADVGAIKHLAFTYDQANLRFYVDGVLISTSPYTQPYVSPAAAALILGVRSDGAPSLNDNAFFAIGGGAYVATQAELATQAAASIAAGQLVAIPGKTDDRRYNFEQDAVDQATSLPARCVNRANATSDDMVRVGSGLTLAQRTERLFSWEVQPIAYGAGGATGAVYSTPNGLVGDSLGWGFVWIGTVDSQAVTAGPRLVVAKRGGTVPGYQFGSIGVNSALQFTVGGAASTVSPTTASVAAGEVGKVLVVGCWYDGSKAHMMVRRLETTVSGALSGGYVASAAAMTVGARSDGFASDGMTTRGLITIQGVPTLAEMQALHDAVIALETIPDMPGRTVNRYDVTKDVLAASGVLPVQLLDRIATEHLTKTGTPVLATTYSRAAA